MVYTICYAFVFLAEILISLFFLKTNLKENQAKNFCYFQLLLCMYYCIYLDY